MNSDIRKLQVQEVNIPHASYSVKINFIDKKLITAAKVDAQNILLEVLIPRNPSKVGTETIGALTANKFPKFIKRNTP